LGRTDSRAVNRKVIEALIRAGVFDAMDGNRATLWENLERLLEAAEAERQRTAYGQQDMFAADMEVQSSVPEMVRHQEWDQATLLQDERDNLGIYFTGHPLDGYAELRPTKGIVELSSLDSRPAGAPVAAIGIVGEIRETVTRSGQRMAFAQLEDYGVTAEVVVFPDAFDASRECLATGAVVAVTGKVDRSRGSSKILAEAIITPEALPNRTYQSVHLRLARSDEERLMELRDLCMERPGECQLYLHYGNGASGGADDGGGEDGDALGNGGEVVIRAAPQLRVSSEDEMLLALEASPVVEKAWAE